MGKQVDLASRRAGGIEVALIWDRDEKTLVVFAHDALTSEEVAIPVTEHEASEVYLHPFAYAHLAVRAQPSGTGKDGARRGAGSLSAPSDRTG